MSAALINSSKCIIKVDRNNSRLRGTVNLVKGQNPSINAKDNNHTPQIEKGSRNSIANFHHSVFYWYKNPHFYARACFSGRKACIPTVMQKSAIPIYIHTPGSSERLENNIVAISLILLSVLFNYLISMNHFSKAV
jgi:hypothetical protein